MRGGGVGGKAGVGCGGKGFSTEGTRYLYGFFQGRGLSLVVVCMGMVKKMVSIGVYVLFYATLCSGTLGIEELRISNKKGSFAEKQNKKTKRGISTTRRGEVRGACEDGTVALMMPTAKPRINALNYVRDDVV